MKTKKVVSKIFTSLFAMVLLLSVSSLNAQTIKKHHSMKHCDMKKDCGMMKDCCMMKDGKMMMMKDGKTMPMTKTMTMKNGTKCMVNGECVMKDGKKMMMKNGDCMDMSGKMCCDKMKMMHKKTTTKKAVAVVYTCPMHNEVIGVKGGECPKCGMDLVKA